MEWQEAVTAFLEGIRSGENASINTYLAYKSDLAQLVDYLSNALPEGSTWADVKPSHIDGYVGLLESRGYSKATIARKVAAAKALFRSLGDHSLITENPSHRVRVPKLEKRAPRTLSEDEVRRLIDAAGTGPQPRALRDRALLSVLYSSGMRVSEVIALRIHEVDLEGNWLICTARGNRQRRIPLSSQASATVRDYLDRARSGLLGSDPTDVVFLNPVGSGLTRQAVWMMIKNYARQAGIDGTVTPHTLRHSRAAHMLTAGEDVHRVKEWLGHANLSTTQAYMPRPETPEAPAVGDVALPESGA